MPTETVRSFWQSGAPGLYQTLSLKSFADRGYRVEVFSYDPAAHLPRWVVRRNAADVLPPERVLRFLPERGRFAVNIDLFRYALLAKFGGWWIDPDVVLLAEQIPGEDIFLAGPDASGLLSTAVMRFPPQHPVPVVAEEFATANAAAVENWPKAGALFLTELAERHGLSSLYQDAAKVTPVSWFDVPRLFDPSPAHPVVEPHAANTFLDLHYDAWIRAGVPVEPGPPNGCLLDGLLRRHNIGEGLSARLDYGNLVQRMTQMYEGLVRPQNSGQ